MAEVDTGTPQAGPGLAPGGGAPAQAADPFALSSAADPFSDDFAPAVAQGEGDGMTDIAF